MFKKLYILILLIPLVGCKQQSSYVRQKMNIDYFIDRYYAINYEYPSSLDELLSFCNNDSSYMQILHDSILHNYSYLIKNKKKINLTIDNAQFPKQKLIVLYNKDTLSCRINDWIFPCIGFYNNAYVDCYLKEPESLDDFLSFCYHCDSLEDGTSGLYDKCNSVTVKNLQKCKQIESFQWINNDDELLIIIYNDTVWYHNNELLPCIDDLKPLFQPHYYDKTLHYIRLGEDINRTFKNNLRELWHPYCNQDKTTESVFYTFVYNKADGLYSFCEDNGIDINTKYFKDMGDYLEKFANEQELSKIIFVAPAVKLEK